MHSSSTANCRIARLNKEEVVRSPRWCCSDRLTRSQRLREQWRVVHGKSKTDIASKKLVSTVKGIIHNAFYVFRTTPGAVHPSLWRAPTTLFSAATGFLFCG